MSTVSAKLKTENLKLWRYSKFEQFADRIPSFKLKGSSQDATSARHTLICSCLLFLVLYLIPILCLKVFGHKCANLLLFGVMVKTVLFKILHYCVV
jgi:hypothetical protein